MSCSFQISVIVAASATVRSRSVARSRGAPASTDGWPKRRTKTTSGGRKIALGSGSGGRGIRATGAKRSLRPAMRYKKAAVHNMAPDKETATPAPPDALQELCVMQPAVLVGLISTISGCALQEDIARIARSFIARGQDILGMNPGAAFASSYETQAHSLPRTAAARAAPI